MLSAELKAIGLRISERRRQLGFTQEQIAEKMDVSVQMVSNLERGMKAIRIENLIKISNILEVSTDYILTGKHTKIDADSMLKRLSKLNDSDLEMIEVLIEHCLNREN